MTLFTAKNLAGTGSTLIR